VAALSVARFDAFRPAFDKRDLGFHAKRLLLRAFFIRPATQRRRDKTARLPAVLRSHWMAASPYAAGAACRLRARAAAKYLLVFRRWVAPASVPPAVDSRSAARLGPHYSFFSLLNITWCLRFYVLPCSDDAAPLIAAVRYFRWIKWRRRSLRSFRLHAG